MFSYGFPSAYRNMNTRRMASIRFEEGRVEEDVPPQVEKVEQVIKCAQGTQRFLSPYSGWR